MIKALMKTVLSSVVFFWNILGIFLEYSCRNIKEISKKSQRTNPQRKIAILLQGTITKAFNIIIIIVSISK